MKCITTTAFALLLSTTALAIPQPQELGAIVWQRHFDVAVKAAKSQQKPLLVLFQEVPGCSTCKNYGDNVLSHPLIVEAAETLFVPTAVFNNIPAEEPLLRSFNEPTWNNPVVRIIDADRKSLAPRLADDYSVAGLANAMVAALQSAQRPVPDYLKLLARESAIRKNPLETATFAMHCFWEGEMRLGALDGVVQTRPGFLNSEEVVEVQYDPRIVDFEKLLSSAQQMQCASRVYPRSDKQLQTATKKAVPAKRTDEKIRLDKEPKYYLTNSEYRFIPMTELQANRVNAALGAKKNPDQFLSARQLAFRDAAKSAKKRWPSYVGVDITNAWQDATQRAKETTLGAAAKALRK